MALSLGLRQNVRHVSFRSLRYIPAAVSGSRDIPICIGTSVRTFLPPKAGGHLADPSGGRVAEKDAFVNGDGVLCSFQIMRKWVVFMGALAVGGAGIWFWLLGSLPAESILQTHLRVTQTPVDVRVAGSDAWIPAKDGQVVSEGDIIRTGATGNATIEFEGKGESRVGKNSELHITRADRSSSAPFAIELQLVTGRVWNRILRLLDLDESFVVQTNSVVATVRGTAFDFQTTTTGTTLWVSDSAVEITGGERGSSASSPEASVVITEGFMATFDERGKVERTQPIDEASRQTDWFVKNTVNDTAFLRATTERLTASMTALGASRPESLTDKLAKFSERLHLTVGGAHAPELFARYTVRRLYAIKRLIEDGNSGAAFQSLASVDEDVSARLTGSDAESYRRYLKSALGDMLLLLKDVGSSSPVYRMKQRVEELNVKLVSTDEVATAYARLVSIEARLDEAGSLITLASLDEARNALDAARQGLQNVERDIDRLPGGVSPARLTALHGKLNVLKVREAAMRIRLATAVAPPTSSLAAPDVSSTSTTSGAATIASETATGTYAGFQKIDLTLLPSPATVGDTVRLKVMGVLPDGNATDITAKSVFTLSGTLGSLNGPAYTASEAGSVTIIASYRDGTNLLTEAHSLEIRMPPVVLKRLDVRAQGSTTLTFQSRVALTVTAVYSDGSTKDVTALSQIVSANPNIGSMVGTLFQAGTVAGPVTVTATYTDPSGSANGTIDLLVTAQ